MNQIKGLEDIKNIRDLMEKSTRYMTLSGFASILAGIYAIIGTLVAYFYVYNQSIKRDIGDNLLPSDYPNDPRILILVIAAIVLFFAVGTALILTRRNARKRGEIFWTKQARHVVYQFIIPLATGGFFSLLLLKESNLPLLASASLIFYGLALLNASKFTFSETQRFAIYQIILGLLAGVFSNYSAIFWAIGFGLFHIIFGIIIYYKYEKSS